MSVRFLKSLFVVGIAVCQFASAQNALPRTPQGKPNLQGIWQAQSRAAYDLQDHDSKQDMPAGKGVVEGGDIPYQPWAAAKKLENFANRKTADPVGKCYFPGVPRIMYMNFPFQIFQTADHVAMTFEWSQVYRLIYLDGKAQLHDGFTFWMGDSRGRWEGDTLVVEVNGHNDKTWFDMAGDFHSEALKLTERYRLLDADTIQYQVTFEDSKVFTKPWQITVPLVRQKSMDRLLEYQCQAEAEEANGLFERNVNTWYPDASATAKSTVVPTNPMPASAALPPVKVDPKDTATLRRMPDGKPDLTGYFQSDGGGANFGLERHGKILLTPAGRGVLIDPADGTLPYQPWARAERVDRDTPQRGYDDPTAHCFVAGVPRSLYVPSPFQILQTPTHIVMLHERMAWRIIPLAANANSRPHLRDSVRLWQGDSIGYWEGDTLVVDTTNLNGKTWLNEVGDVVSYAEHVVERYIPVSPKKMVYRATITDPIAYTRPWTMEIPLNREDEQLLEVACHEDNGDLQHLKDVRDEYRKQHKSK